MSNVNELYAGSNLPLRRSLIETHTDVWNRLTKSGPFWSGSDRMQIIQESRQSLECNLCLERLQALSPNAIKGVHDSVTDLPEEVVEVVHRLRTDPARMTKSVFDNATASVITVSQYVELIGTLAISVIIDTLHKAVGLGVPSLQYGSSDPPQGQAEPDVVDAGAWFPISVADGEVNEIGVPRTANIVRSMGLVPEIVTLFFLTMREGYYISKLPLDLERSQTEFIAAKVSALNQCFY